MTLRELQALILPYTRPSISRSIGQLLTSLLPYIALWAVMVAMLTQGVSYGYVLPLLVLTVPFQVRLFIIFHDACHQSFFASRQANRVVGTILGVLMLTPYDGWAHEHLTHHATVADLGRRGIGDIWTMTVAEYRAASRWRRLQYRLVRHPLNFLLVGPIWVFMVYHRLFPKNATTRIKWNVIFTNLALAGILGIFWLTVGWQAFVLIQLPLTFLGGALGIWLFYVQHQFDPTHWYPHEKWDFLDAALHASSYYKLPRILQWMTGNIGLHHVHHVNARIPNYNLQAALDATPHLHIKPMTFLDSLKTVRMNLWDEQHQRLISFRELGTIGSKTRVS